MPYLSAWITYTNIQSIISMFTRKIALQGDTHNLTEGLGVKVIGAAIDVFL